MVLGSDKVPDIHRLIELGQLDQARQKLTISNHSATVKTIYSIYILHEQGSYMEMLALAREIENNDLPLNHRLSLLYWTAWANHRLSNYAACVNLANQGLDLIAEDQGYQIEKAYLLKAKAASIKEKGNIQQALDLNTAAISLAEEEPSLHCALLNNTASIYFYLGNYGKAHELFLQVERMSEREGLHSLNAAAHLNLGEVNKNKGQLAEALNHLHQAREMYLRNVNTDGLAFSCRMMAEVFLLSKQFDRAEMLVNESLEFYKKSEVSYFYGFALFLKIKIAIALGQTPQQPLDQLEILAATTNNPIISQIAQLGLALVLKNKSDFLSLGQASTLLTKLMDQPVLLFEITYEATIHRCDLLIQEYMISGNLALITQIEDHLGTLLDTAEKNHSSSKIIEILMIQAKLQSVLNRFDIAIERLNRAKEISIETGLDGYQLQIRKELDDVTVRLETIEQVLKSNLTTLDKVKEVGIIDYMNSVVHFHKTGESTE